MILEFLKTVTKMPADMYLDYKRGHSEPGSSGETLGLLFYLTFLMLIK